MDRMMVSIKVHPTIREFIIDTNGSDVIIPNKNDLLWKYIKANLTTYNEKEKQKLSAEEEKDCIYIALLELRGDESFSMDKGYIFMNQMYRCFITEKGQKQIAKELRIRFKQTFHTFVLGALLGNPNLQQKEAFLLFMQKFNLTENKINYEMLKKSWDRSLEKKMIHNRKRFCNIIF